MTMPAADQEIDARDLLCPLPVLRARKALLALKTGQVLRVVATDPAARIDMPHFAQSTGQIFLGHEELEGAIAYYFERSEQP